MRTWHPDLLPHLCRNHLLAQWRENLGLYSIITNNKKAYRNHPQTKQYENHPFELYNILQKTRQEMLKRSYNPKPLPEPTHGDSITLGKSKQWQTKQEQIQTLIEKQCDCDTQSMST